MDVLEFKKIIESIGFKDINYAYYEYKEYTIYLYGVYYDFHNGFYWNSCTYELNDLTPIQENFKKKLRSVKLKKILG